MNNNNNNKETSFTDDKNTGSRKSFLNLLDKLSPRKQQSNNNTTPTTSTEQLETLLNESNNNNKRFSNNSLDEIILQKDIIKDLGEIADRNETLVTMVTTENKEIKQNYEKVLKENQTLIEITNSLEDRVESLCKELSYHKDNSIETIIDKLKNGITPSGIDSIRSIQDKDQLLSLSTKLYQEEFNEDVLFKVLMFLKSTLSWKLFINLLRHHCDSLDYYIGYCKETNNYDDLIKFYREIRNPLEEGIAMVNQAANESDPDRVKYLLYSCSNFFDQYSHLAWYKETLDQFIYTRNALEP